MKCKACSYCNAVFEQNKNEQYCSLKCAVLSRATILSEDECWEWNGPIGSHGYGAFSFLNTHYTSHRASYIAHFGDIPALPGVHGGVVMHSCDNRKCVNPKHLSVGTQADNLLDAKSKGRNVTALLRGEKARTAILTEGKVIEIRQRLDSGETGAALAKEYGVTTSAISSIKQRKSWKHI